MFPTEDGVSEEYSPLVIATESPNPDIRSYSMDFGAYIKVFEDNGWFQNSNRSRSTPTIALGPFPYRRPGQILMSLVRGKRLCRKKWTELPMPS